MDFLSKLYNYVNITHLKTSPNFDQTTNEKNNTSLLIKNTNVKQTELTPTHQLLQNLNISQGNSFVNIRPSQRKRSFDLKPRMALFEGAKLSLLIFGINFDRF